MELFGGCCECRGEPRIRDDVLSGGGSAVGSFKGQPVVADKDRYSDWKLSSQYKKEGGAPVQSHLALPESSGRRALQSGEIAKA